MRAAIALVLLSSFAWGQARPSYPVKTGTIVTAAGSTLVIDGGVWLPSETAQADGQELVNLRAALARKQAAAEAPPDASVYLVIFGLAAVVFVGGYAAGRL